MTGEQFRILRVLNGITQTSIARQVGKGDRNKVRRIEAMPFVPQQYLKALGALLNVNLTKPDETERYLAEYGITPPPQPSQNQDFDWAKFFPSAELSRSESNLWDLYCRDVRKVSRQEFSYILYYAIQRGHLRTVTWRNTIEYSGYKFPQPDDEEDSGKS